MDLIFTNPKREDLGVLHNYEFDLAFGSDENNFECVVSQNDHHCQFGSYLYIEGTEYGGIVDSIKSQNSSQEVVYSGRTWHGILNSKVLEPDSGEAYLICNGEANEVIAELVSRMGLSDLFIVSEEDSGLVIASYKMNRYVNGYEGILKMLKSVDGKLLFSVQSNGQVLLSVVPIVDYTAEGLDSDLIDLDVKRTANTVNHLICLGSGELENRTVIHLYSDEDGNISQAQTFSGIDEYVAVFDYPNAESAEELLTAGSDRLKELMQQDDLSVDVNDVNDPYDVGDIVGAVDNITNIKITVPITKKIVTIKNGIVTIDIKTETGNISVSSSGSSGGSGSPGADGQDGQDGKDGVSCTHEWNGTVLTVTSASGTSSADLKGEPGNDGQDGYTPVKGVDYFDGTDGKDGADGSPGADGVSCSHSWNGTVLEITSASGTSSADLKGEAGKDGADGSPGQDGYTPVKGVDYFDGEDGQDGKDGADGVSVTHEWNGTVLTITSASGTSSADLKGDPGDPGEGGGSNITFATEEPTEEDGADGELRLVHGYVTEEVPGGLPDGYTELAYIESTGTQYVDTGFKANSNSRIVMDFESNGKPSSSTIVVVALFGARAATTTSCFGVWMDDASAYPHYGSVGYKDNGYISVNTKSRLIYDLNKNVLTVGTQSITCQEFDFTQNYTSCILAMNTTGTIDERRAVGKIYSCQIYDNDVLVRDFIPCLNADGEAGLYDLVNSVFYGDAAGGAFVAGDEVPAETEEVPVGSGFFKVDGVWYPMTAASATALTVDEIRAICT